MDVVLRGMVSGQDGDGLMIGLGGLTAVFSNFNDSVNNSCI